MSGGGHGPRLTGKQKCNRVTGRMGGICGVGLVVVHPGSGCCRQGSPWLPPMFAPDARDAGTDASKNTWQQALQPPIINFANWAVLRSKCPLALDSSTASAQTSSSCGCLLQHPRHAF